MPYCCFCCKALRPFDLVDQERTASKEKITFADGVVNLSFLSMHLAFLGLEVIIIHGLMSDPDAQVFDISSIIFDNANRDMIRAKEYGGFWHGFFCIVILAVTSLLSMGGGNSGMKSKINRMCKMVPLADTLFMFIKKAKPLGSSFSNMFATLTERIPITLVNVYLAMHLWTGSHLTRDDPIPNSHWLVPYIVLSIGLSLLTICVSIAEFEASEAIDFEIADISQSSFYYFFLVAYRFTELASRMVLLACVGTTFMTAVLVFDVLAMTMTHLGAWGAVLLSPWLTAVMFIPFTTIDIWRLRKYLPQHWLLKTLEALVLIGFTLAVHVIGYDYTGNAEMNLLLHRMSNTQREMCFVGFGLWALQYLCLYSVLKIGHTHYARSIPEPGVELAAAWVNFKRVVCTPVRWCKARRKKRKASSKRSAKVDIDVEIGTPGAMKEEELVVQDYSSGEEETRGASKVPEFTKVYKVGPAVSTFTAIDATKKALESVSDAPETTPTKPTRQRSKKLKRKGTMML